MILLKVIRIQAFLNLHGVSARQIIFYGGTR